MFRIRKYPLLVSLMLGTVLASTVVSMPAVASGPEPIRIVSTPNPSVLPLLLAMAREPDLPVELIPVGGGSEIAPAFREKGADGLLSMTWVAASQARSNVPDLKLVAVDFWRGFFELTPADSGVTRLADLQGKNLLISGPVGGGRDGGPDYLFMGMMKREGFDSTNYTEGPVTLKIGDKTLSTTRRVYHDGDFRIYYLPAMDAAKVLISKMPLDNGDDGPGNEKPASGAFMVEPATNGIAMNGMMKGEDLDRGIDVQKVFTGFRAWEPTELPLGGLSLRASVWDDPERARNADRVIDAYNRAAEDLMAAKGRPFAMRRLTTKISDGVDKYFKNYGLSIPPVVIGMAIFKGGLVYRTDRSVRGIMPDLKRFNTELLGVEIPNSFYR